LTSDEGKVEEELPASKRRSSKGDDRREKEGCPSKSHRIFPAVLGRKRVPNQGFKSRKRGLEGGKGPIRISLKRSRNPKPPLYDVSRDQAKKVGKRTLEKNTRKSGLDRGPAPRVSQRICPPNKGARPIKGKQSRERKTPLGVVGVGWVVGGGVVGGSLWETITLVSKRRRTRVKHPKESKDFVKRGKSRKGGNERSSRNLVLARGTRRLRDRKEVGLLRKLKKGIREVCTGRKPRSGCRAQRSGLTPDGAQKKEGKTGENPKKKTSTKDTRRKCQTRSGRGRHPQVERGDSAGAEQKEKKKKSVRRREDD